MPWAHASGRVRGDQPRLAEANLDWSNPITFKLVCAAIAEEVNSGARTRNLLYPTWGVSEGGYGYESGVRTNIDRYGSNITFNGGGYTRGVSFPLLPSTPDLTTATVFFAYGSVSDGYLHYIGGPSYERPSDVKIVTGGYVYCVQGQDTSTGAITHQDTVRSNALNVVVYRNRHTAGDAYQDVWLNGVQSSTTTASSAQSGYRGSSCSFGMSTSPSHAIGFHAVLVWNRILSDAEVRSYSLNPWQIFREPMRGVFFPAATSTATLPAWGYGPDGQRMFTGLRM